MRRCLVTGAAGFIGSHLVESLLKSGDHVVGIDNYFTGRHENLEGCRYLLDMHTIDIRNRWQMKQLILDADEVYHLAAHVGVAQIHAHPVEAISVNVHGTEQLTSLCQEYGRRLFIASSSEVYGLRAGVMCEDDNIVLGPTSMPRWSYAASKALTEWHALGLTTAAFRPVIGRFFNVAGPRQLPTAGVLPSFIQAALRGDPLIVHGDGEQSRCFSHVSDVVRCVIGLVRGDGHGVFNIGANTSHSILQVARMVVEITGSNSKIEHVDHRQVFGERFSDVRGRVPDVSKLARQLNTPVPCCIGLRQIIQDTAAHMTKGLLSC